MKTKKPVSDDIRKEIALRAYYIWEREGRPAGREHEHWALAEAEIVSEPPVKTAEAPKTPVKKTAVAAKVEPVKTPAPVEKKAAAPAKKGGNGAATTVAAAAAKAKKTGKTKSGKPLPRA